MHHRARRQRDTLFYEIRLRAFLFAMILIVGAVLIWCCATGDINRALARPIGDVLHAGAAPHGTTE